MGESDDLTEPEIRHAVRDGVFRGGWSILSAVFWTILAVFTVLVGLQAVQIAVLPTTTGFAAIAFAAIGLLITGASIYLLYLLHWD